MSELTNHNQKGSYFFTTTVNYQNNTQNSYGQNVYFSYCKTNSAIVLDFLMVKIKITALYFTLVLILPEGTNFVQKIKDTPSISTLTFSLMDSLKEKEFLGALAGANYIIADIHHAPCHIPTTDSL